MSQDWDIFSKLAGFLGQNGASYISESRMHRGNPGEIQIYESYFELTNASFFFVFILFN